MSFYTRLLQAGDPEQISSAFTAIGWNKPVTQYERYLGEQASGRRTVIIALNNDTFAGYITINWQPSYPPFHAENTPEIQDFNVLTHFRRQGLGNQLMAEAEQIVAQRDHQVIGIGVGLYADYGAAQRMYIRRGYILDGRGLVSHDRFVKYGETVVLDDNLNLYFTRRL